MVFGLWIQWIVSLETKDQSISLDGFGFWLVLVLNTIIGYLDHIFKFWKKKSKLELGIDDWQNIELLNFMGLYKKCIVYEKLHHNNCMDLVKM